MALLAIHGLLHLLGYDDETEAAASVMWSRQKELLEMILGPRPQVPGPAGLSGSRRRPRAKGAHTGRAARTARGAR